MYKKCQTEQSAARQRQLEQGLLRCMLKRQYEEITVMDLCEEMGIPRKSFYRYFSGKDGALFALLDHAMLDYDNCSLEVAAESGITVRQYMERMFSYWKTCKPLLDAVDKSGLSSVLIMRAVEYSQNHTALDGFVSREEKQRVDYGTMFAVCGLMSIMLQWHKDGFSQSVEQMADLTIRLLSKPLITDAE